MDESKDIFFDMRKCAAILAKGGKQDDALRLLDAHDAADGLLEALELIAGTDPVDAALDPGRAIRVARDAIAKATGPQS